MEIVRTGTRSDGTKYKYSFDPEPNKDRDIERNTEEADLLNLQDKHLRPNMPTTNRATALEFYNRVTEHLKSVDLKDLDVTDVKAVVSKARELLNETNKNDFLTSTGACFSVAASIAAIFDKKKVAYNVFEGVAGKTPNFKEKDLPRLGGNHVWVKALGKRYEYFEGQAEDFPHYSVTAKIDFKKGAR